jgi:hypothetical protein
MPTTRPPTTTQARSSEGRLFSSDATVEHGTIWIINDDIRSEGEGAITTELFPEDC